MTLHERTGVRDLAYSRWHRPSSVARFIGKKLAARLSVIDIDWCEYCDVCREPIALIETERAARTPKDARVTARLAELAGIDAFSVAYEVDEHDDLVSLRLRQLHPSVPGVTTYTPQEYALFLCTLRRDHDCRDRNREAS